jgi:ribosomal-protein-alanine N-acetyltransferase
MNTTGKLSRSGPSDQDWEQIQELDFLYFPRPWSPREWASLDLQHHRIYSWSQDNRLQGFALFAWVKGDDTAHLLKICLIPESRGVGMGQAFWKELLSQLKGEGIIKVFLEVEESNLNALSFYRKLGFETLRTVKAFYSDGANGLMMIGML